MACGYQRIWRYGSKRSKQERERVHRVHQFTGVRFNEILRRVHVMCTVRSTDNNKQKLTRSTNPNKTYRISNAFTRLVSRLSYSSQVTHLVRVFSQVFDETTSLWLHASNSSGGKLRSKHGRFVVKGRGGDFPEANRAHVETDTQRR
jgi:hypothetical protein